MNHDEQHPPAGRPTPPWLASVPEDERAELQRAWEVALLARGDRPDADAVDAAAERFWGTVSPPEAPSRLAADRPPGRHSLRLRRRPVMQAVGALALLAAGIVVGLALNRGGLSTPGAATPPDQERFMVLIRGGTFGERTPQEQAQMVAAFRDWAGELARANRLQAGDQLAEDGRILVPAGGTVAARPYVRPDDGVGGYFVITAKDYAEALALARDCPQLRFGGSVEVRRIIAN